MRYTIIIQNVESTLLDQFAGNIFAGTILATEVLSQTLSYGV